MQLLVLRHYRLSWSALAGAFYGEGPPDLVPSAWAGSWAAVFHPCSLPGCTDPSSHGPSIMPIKASRFQREVDKAFIEFMILIYNNSNPITSSLLSAACMVAEFNYSQARFPLLVGTFVSLLEVHPPVA